MKSIMFLQIILNFSGFCILRFNIYVSSIYGGNQIKWLKCNLIWLLKCNHMKIIVFLHNKTLHFLSNKELKQSAGNMEGNGNWQNTVNDKQSNSAALRVFNLFFSN